MKLIIGGAFQGKRKAAEALMKGAGRIIDGENCKEEEIYQAALVDHLHLYLRRFPQDDPQGFIETLYQRNPDVVLVMNELGCGIVPVDREDRRWREMCGRCGCEAARCSEQVWRVLAGIPSRIQ